MNDRHSPQQPAEQPTGRTAIEGAARSQHSHRGDADLGVYLAFLEFVQRGRGSDAGPRFLAPGFVEHRAAGSMGGHELLADLWARRAQFPDEEWTIELLVS